MGSPWTQLCQSYLFFTTSLRFLLEVLCKTWVVCCPGTWLPGMCCYLTRVRPRWRTLAWPLPTGPPLTAASYPSSGQHQRSASYTLSLHSYTHSPPSYIFITVFRIRVLLTGSGSDFFSWVRNRKKIGKSGSYPENPDKRPKTLSTRRYTILY